MQITKDHKYFGVYLACIIIATILTVGVIGAMLYFINNANNAYFEIIGLLLLAIVGNIFAWASFYGYMKTPSVLLNIIDRNVIIAPNKDYIVETTIDDIISISVNRGLFCRSGKKMTIVTKTGKYVLEDVKNLYESYKKLIEIKEGKNA